jgi:hypothetical protein
VAHDRSLKNKVIIRRLVFVVEQAASLTVLKDLCGALPGLEGGADAVREVVEKAAYMVLGLGDVYLGAPCAVPVDPRWAAVLLFCSRSGAVQLAVLYGSATPTQLTDTMLSSGKARQQGWPSQILSTATSRLLPLGILSAQDR